MRWLKAYVLCVIFFAAPHAFSAVSAQLSAQNIDELESVFLRIKVTETRQSQPLDLTALADDFDILNTNTVSQSRYLNGRGQNWVDYQITLQPKKNRHPHHSGNHDWPRNHTKFTAQCAPPVARNSKNH